MYGTFHFMLCYTGAMTNATKLRQGREFELNKPFGKLPKPLTLPICLLSLI